MDDFRQRLQHWYRHDVESLLYQSTTDLLLSSAPPTSPDLQVYCCDQTNLQLAKQVIVDFPKTIERRVLAGDLAILAVQDAHWVFRSTAVLGPKTYPVTGFPLTLSPREAYLEYAETVPAWRGKGVAPSMLGPTAMALLKREIEIVYLIIDITNTASCHAAVKGGAISIGRITGHRRLGRWHTDFQQIGGTIPVTRQDTEMGVT